MVYGAVIAVVPHYYGLFFEALFLFFSFTADIRTGQANRSLDPLVALSANIPCLFEAINDASLQVRRMHACLREKMRRYKASSGGEDMRGRGK